MNKFTTNLMALCRFTLVYVFLENAETGVEIRVREINSVGVAAKMPLLLVKASISLFLLAS